jgi:hypothetical protein
MNRTEQKTRMQPWERRERERATKLWRDPKERAGDSEFVLLLMKAEHGDQQYVLPAHDMGDYGWETTAGRRITAGVAGWMPMSEAVTILRRASRGDLKR